MSDLISRSALIELIQSHDDITLDRFSELSVIRVIKEQPTTYDVEKVVAELEELEQSRLEMHDWQGQSAICDAIGIVRKGGVE